jgi:hypothetical protein
MRLLIGFFLIALISACSGPTPTVAPTSALPTQTLPPQQSTTTEIATVTSNPADLAPFEAGLRPEFLSDLSLVHNPSVYRLRLQIDPSLAHLSGQETVTFTNRTQKPLDQVYFRLFANFPSPGGNDMESVTAVQVNGSSVTPTLESQDTALRVPLAQALPPNGVANFDLNFGVTIPVSNTAHYSDFTNSEGIITLPSIYPLIPAYDEKGWHTELPPAYGDLVYADTSLYDVTVTAPVTMTVVGSGSTIGTSIQGAEKTWHLVGAPMRDFDVDLSSSLQVASEKVGEVSVNSYYLPADEEAGTNVLKWASSALAVYEKRIGPYPFKELDVVETPTSAGGIEYPGIVVIASELYRNPKEVTFFEFAVAHEVSHQWWYSQVGDDQVNTPWMDESFAQYSTYIYFQDTYGEAAASRVFQTAFQDEFNQAKKDNEDLPVGLPVSAYTEKQYGEIVYGKGPLFFDAVRKQIGDDYFYKFMRTYYQRFKYQIAKPKDLLATIDEVSGQKVDPLYSQWISGQ